MCPRLLKWQASGGAGSETQTSRLLPIPALGGGAGAGGAEGRGIPGLDPGVGAPSVRCREEGDSDGHQVHLREGCPEALQGPGNGGAPPAGTGHGAQHPVPALAERGGRFSATGPPGLQAASQPHAAARCQRGQPVQQHGRGPTPGGRASRRWPRALAAGPEEKPGQETGGVAGGKEEEAEVPVF